MKDTFKGVFIGIYENETAKHFGGLFTKKGGDIAAATFWGNYEYLILMKGNLHYMLFLQQLIIIQGTLEIKS